MKKLFLFALLSVLHLAASAQITVQVPIPDTLVGKNYLKTYVRQALEELSSIPEKETQESDPNLSPCEFGPELKAVSSVTPLSLIATFHGVNVFKIAWKIKDASGKTVRSGELEPQNSTPGISFSSLPAGSYTLVFTGKSCSSAPSEKGFVIPENTGSVPQLPVGNSDLTHKVITRGLPEHMDIRFSGKPGDWILDDVATPGLEEGYEFRYMINAQLLTQGVPLAGYKLQSNGPLRIWKMKTRIGLETVNKWSDKDNTYYYSTTAGTPFSYNSSAAIYTSVFTGTDIGQKTGFLNFIPQAYDPSVQGTQWADFAPDMQLPKNRFWVAYIGEWNIDLLRRKGVTHFSHFQLPWNDADGNKEVNLLKDAGQTYNDVPRIEHFMHLSESGPDNWKDGYNTKYWPNGPLTPEQAIQKANEADISDAIWIGESLEGNSVMPQEADMWRHFYKRLRERYEERFGKRGIPYLICHNYFQFWPESVNLATGRQAAKNLMRLPVEQLPCKNFTPGGTLASTNLIVDAVYLNAPDIQNDAIYQSLFKMELIKRMGYKAGIFSFGVHEWRPNNFYEYVYPDGKYYHQDKIPLDPNVMIAYSFLSHIYGNIYVEWGAPAKQSSRSFDPQWSKGIWYPNGASSPQGGFPHFVKPGQKAYAGYTGSADLSYFGIKLYHDTFAKVDGGEKRYLRFRIDDGAWINPAQDFADEIVDAYHDKRGFVLSQSKDGRTAWFYLNSFADNRSHRIQVELPGGSIITDTVSANGIHATIQ
ncbi:hypothetical protein DYBT9275_05849 [Dyadobacter sp. CECT 9275]|uniref:Uncharacterized protein n=1 Tax=Dyadobacter helix TaxID=2822344 RepID=A0A916JIJ9_9BACT|nr:hypothetical protein [Dyadobacter sp. CECT 9275]CAG5017798.1 hypothetical protein DYBT9275_05849 [Dyadobacter sp. CECT 9275]